MTLARVVTRVACLNPVATLDRYPLIRTWIKSVVTQELLSFLNCQKAAMHTSNICLMIFVVHVITRSFYVPDLCSFEVLILNLIENQLAHLGAASVAVVSLDPEKEPFGRAMWLNTPFIPLPARTPLSRIIVHAVDHMLTIVMSDCHELPLLRITTFTIIC